jgi:hypothetical protein
MRSDGVIPQGVLRHADGLHLSFCDNAGPLRNRQLLHLGFDPVRWCRDKNGNIIGADQTHEKRPHVRGCVAVDERAQRGGATALIRRGKIGGPMLDRGLIPLLQREGEHPIKHAEQQTCAQCEQERVLPRQF